ncbi:MAG: MBL fold metallo-hydrolase [Lachnospiraceae bacterium]|nr:MBL fold metallo-hydrolase [Lachnospiraceae bacterium]
MMKNIRVFTQSSIKIQDGSKAIYIDPFQMKEAPKDADYILITHDHSDHFSPEDIGKVAKSSSVLIVPEGMASKASQVGSSVGSVETVKPGESREISGLKLETVASYNISKQFHPKSSGWVGYILTVEGKRIYIAGDMDATPEAKAVKCDVAMVPIGGTYTMDAKEAAELINAIAPEVAIPTHYGSVVGSPADADTFSKNVKAPVKVEVILGK